jgi:hypothetical protein
MFQSVSLVGPLLTFIIIFFTTTCRRHVLFSEAEFEALGADIARVARSVSPAVAAAMARRNFTHRQDPKTAGTEGTLTSADLAGALTSTLRGRRNRTAVFF